MESSRTRRAVRAFVDSSVLFAAAASSTGFARDLLIQGLRGELDLVYCAWVIEETTRNLSRKRADALPLLREFVATLPSPAPEPPRALVIEVATIIEPEDAPIVAGAIMLKATHLATFDRRHLLSQAVLIHQHFGVTVATPDEILRQT